MVRQEGIGGTVMPKSVCINGYSVLLAADRSDLGDCVMKVYDLATKEALMSANYSQGNFVSGYMHATVSFPIGHTELAWPWGEEELFRSVCLQMNVSLKDFYCEAIRGTALDDQLKYWFIDL